MKKSEMAVDDEKLVKEERTELPGEYMYICTS